MNETDDHDHSATGRSARRVAAIDIGTNAVRLIVAEADLTDGYRKLGDEREQTRLGRRLHATGSIGSEAMERTLDALERMVAIAEEFGTDEVRAIGTAALREADNGEALVDTVRERLGLDIQVITPEREADLAVRSVRRRFRLDGEPVAIVDIGGGSMEVVLSAEGMIDEVHSMPLGAVRLSERYVDSDPISAADWRRLCAGIDRELEWHLGERPAPAPLLIGSGGTFTALAALVMRDPPGVIVPVQGFEMSPADVERQLRRLREAPLSARRRLPGMEADRADIILAGATAVARLADRLEAGRIRINDGGVRDGLLLTMLEGSR